MMKKSLIALALVAAAPVAFAATSNVDLYGQMRVSVDKADNSVLNLVDRNSRLGVKGSEDLGGGLTAIWQIETQMDITANGQTGGSFTKARNTFVGAKSAGFGTVLLGTHDTPYKLGTGSLDVFADTAADYNNVIVETGSDYRSGEVLAYISPTWSGLHFAVATVPSQNKPNGAVSATAVYVNGPLFASYSYQDLNTTDASANDEHAKLGLGYTFGDVKVGLVYEDNGAASNSKGILGNVAYAMGPITLKAAYGQRDHATTDGKQVAVGATYALSKRTNVELIYNKQNAVNVTADTKTTSIGVNHSF
jgi:predicted porin